MKYPRESHRCQGLSALGCQEQHGDMASEISALVSGIEATKAEVEAAKTAGAHILTLGSRILRTETAAIAALAILMFQLEQ